MLKKMFFALLVSALPLTASANWVVGADYVRIGGLGAILGSAGYKIPLRQEGGTVIVGARLGAGIQDDVFVDLDTVMGLEATYQYDFGNDWYAQGTLAWHDLNYIIDDGAGTMFAALNDSELVIGVGGGFQFRDDMAVEVGFESWDYDDALSVGIRYHP